MEYLRQTPHYSIYSGMKVLILLPFALLLTFSYGIIWTFPKMIHYKDKMYTLAAGNLRLTERESCTFYS